MEYAILSKIIQRSLFLFLWGIGALLREMEIVTSVQRTLLPINIVLIQNVCQWETNLTAVFTN